MKDKFKKDIRIRFLMKNYILGSVLAAYLALASMTNNGYATSVQRRGFKDNKPTIEEHSELPLDITITVPEIKKQNENSTYADFLRKISVEIRLFLDRNKQPTLAPSKGLENKVEFEMQK